MFRLTRKVSLRLIFATCLTPILGVAADTPEEEKEPLQLEAIQIIGDLSTFSATKSDTPILETARSVVVKTEEQGERIGAKTVADTFSYTPGVHGNVFGFDTRGDWGRVRGFEPVTYQDSLQSLFGNYNSTRPELYTLEQVEILKGPASVLYGKGSPGGIINTVSKLPKEEAEKEIVLSVGNNDYRQLGVDLTGPIGGSDKWFYRLVGVIRDSGSQFDFVEEEANVLAPSITFKPSDDTNISLSINYNDIETDTGNQFLPIQGTLEDAPNGDRISSSFYSGEPDFNQYDGGAKSISLIADHTFNDVWSAQVTARKTESNIDYQQAWTSLGFGAWFYNADGSLYENGTVPRSFFQSYAETEQEAIDVRFRAEFSTGSVDHDFIIGAQYQNVTIDEDTLYAYALGLDPTTFQPDAFVGDTYWLNLFDPEYGNVPTQEILDAYDAFGTDTKTKTVDKGFYLSDQVSIGNLKINAGLRFDDVKNEVGDFSQDDDAISKSIGALYEFDNGVSPYASYAESFQPVVGIDANTGNPLKPQEGEQIEVGIKYNFENNPGYITFAYFDIEQSNLVTTTATTVGSTQIAESNVQGWELEAKYKFNKFYVDAALSQIDTETDEGFQFSSVPRDQASLWVGYAPKKLGFSAGAGVRYIGETLDGADDIETPSVTLLDATIAYDTQDWQFRLNAKNLADKEFQATCLARGDCFTGERRSVVGTVTYKF